MKLIRKTLTFATICLSIAAFAPTAIASVVIAGTRIVYNQNDSEVTVKLTNNGKLPGLTKVWIDRGDPNAKPDSIEVPFTIMPPIMRIDPGKSQTLRIMSTGEELPADKESLFYLNVLEVPPKPTGDEASPNQLQLAFRTRIKLFFRPNGLKGQVTDAPAQVIWHLKHDGDQNMIEATITYMAARLMLGGVVSVGVFYSFLIYKSLMSERFANAINAMFQYFMLSVPVARVDDIVEAQTETYTPLSASERATEIRDFSSIEMRNVTFSYGVSDKPVLADLDLSIRKGDKIVITGPSGSGKSTVFKLLSAAEPLREGHIELNGIAWPNLAVDEIRRHMAHMRQGDIILHGSIADNITLFAANPDDDRIHRLLSDVGLLDDVMRLPMRTRTVISDTIANISAGQRQRLLLARALYQQREILMLDEPTSNLDPASVKHIAQLLRSLKQTVVVITHDMALASAFDMRYAFANGGLVPEHVVQASDPVLVDA